VKRHKFKGVGVAVIRVVEPMITIESQMGLLSLEVTISIGWSLHAYIGWGPIYEMFPRHHCYAKNYSICGKQNPPFPCQERPRRRCEQCLFINISVHQFVRNSFHEDSTLPPLPSPIFMPLVSFVSNLVTNLITSKTLNYNTMNIQKVLCFPTRFNGNILFGLSPL
jgi:hypothetical protein